MKATLIVEPSGENLKEIFSECDVLGWNERRQKNEIFFLNKYPVGYFGHTSFRQRIFKSNNFHPFIRTSFMVFISYTSSYFCYFFLHIFIITYYQSPLNVGHWDKFHSLRSLNQWYFLLFFNKDVLEGAAADRSVSFYFSSFS